MVGGSNDTANLGTQFDPNGMTVPSSVLTTDGEIVRMRATLQLSEGTNTGVLVGAAVIEPTGEAWLDRFLGLPDEALAVLECQLSLAGGLDA